VLGPLEKAVTNSLGAQKFEDKETWGRTLALKYARQIDEAERIKSEVRSILDEADTASKTWHQRLVQIEKYVVAEGTLNNTGPKLLALLEKLGMTPALTKSTNGRGGQANDGAVSDPVEDELAALRAKRGPAARSS
jgi:hypothetical protein